ncbi:MAG TPA: tetratricopeptide repeat protein [Patescibacteria group bacterium]|nr:tetratricopeptide repeat protein [Patescibacteria group bacterium]
MQRLLKNIILLFVAVIAIVVQSCSNTEAEKKLTEGKILVDAKKWEDAITKLTIAIDEGDNKTKAKAYYQRALAKEQLRDEKGAIADYTEALKLNENDYESWHNRGILKDNMNDRFGAIEDYTRAIEVDEKRYEAYLNRGVVYSNMSKRTEALSDFKKATERNPEFARAWYFLALTKKDLNDTSACFDAKNAEILGLPEATEFLKANCGQRDKLPF